MCVSLSVVSDTLQPHGLWPARLLCPWNFPGKNLEWVAISFSRGSSRPRDQTQVSCIADRFFTICWCCSVTKSCPIFMIPWTAAHQASLSFTVSLSLLKLMPKSVMPSNHLILCLPLLFLPSIFPSIRIISNESAFCITWPKYWSFSFSSLSNEYSGLIAFRINWFDLLVPKGLSRVFSSTTVQNCQLGTQSSEPPTKLIQQLYCYTIHVEDSSSNVYHYTISSRCEVPSHTSYHKVSFHKFNKPIEYSLCVMYALQTDSLLSVFIVQLLSCFRLFVTPMDCSLLGSSVHGISRQEYWNGGCHFLFQWIFLTQG